VIVVGSVNLDLVYRVPHLPRPGETLIGADLVRLSGGKGGNQAHAAARVAPAGVAVAMIACVGDDDAAGRLRDDLARVGVDKNRAAIDAVQHGYAQHPQVQHRRDGEDTTALPERHPTGRPRPRRRLRLGIGPALGQVRKGQGAHQQVPLATLHDIDDLDWVRAPAGICCARYCPRNIGERHLGS